MWARLAERRNDDPETVIEDPLSLATLEVTDFSTARYALKTANDQHCACIHMFVQMQNELNRSILETAVQKLYIVQQYVQAPDPVTGALKPITYIPNPLPDKVPPEARAGINYLDEQLAIETARMAAEWEQNSDHLLAIRDYLLLQVEKWFISEVENDAGWLHGRKVVTMGGCILSYIDGVFGWEFHELEYGD